MSFEKFGSDADAVTRITALLNKGTPIEAISVFVKRDVQIEQTFRVAGV